MSLGAALARDIAARGSIPVAEWMARCNAHYYATRDPLGPAGDFTTAPEISQMFGELIGACLADAWARAGRPPVRLVELGPGRGTLMADLRRAARIDAPVHLVETSPALRSRQEAQVPDATWHDALADVPGDRPLLLVANEFFDALPVRQFQRAGQWRERHAGPGATVLAGPPVDALVPPQLRAAPEGSVFETSPAGTAVAAELGRRLREHGGVALIIDYGHSGPALGDTLQAVRGHRFADPFADPGEADLTAHVDFTALADAAGVTAHGPVGQGPWLKRLGIDARAALLKRWATPGQAADIDAAVARLTGEMGELFKVLALTGPDWPMPAGFAA